MELNPSLPSRKEYKSFLLIHYPLRFPFGPSILSQGHLWWMVHVGRVPPSLHYTLPSLSACRLRVLLLPGYYSAEDGFGFHGNV